MVTKSLKKLFSILLCVAMLTSVFAILPVSAESDNALKIAVATDIHTIEVPETLPTQGRDEGLYWQSYGSGSMYYESIAALRTFVDGAKSNGAEYILITGDLCTEGTIAQYTYLSKILGELEKSSGISIYVTPGNHDFFEGGTVETFKQYFADFGYSEALTVDSATASYTADLDDNYRLLVIDSNDHKTNGDGIDKRLVSWIKEQAAQADKDGKKLIAMMHHPLMEHIKLHSIVMPDFVVKNWEYMSALLADLGIKYCFTGHIHNNDIARYTSINGNEVYDVTTGTLTALRPCYRIVTFSDSGVEFKLEKIEKIKKEYLSGGYNEAQINAITTDFQSYALGYFDYCLETTCKKFLDADYLNELTKNMLGRVINKVIPRVYEAVFLPINTTDGSKNFSEIAAKYDIELPELKDKSLFDLAMDACHAYYFGDTHIAVDDDLVQQIVHTVHAALTYAFDGVSGKDKNNIMSTVLESLGIDFDALRKSLGIKSIDEIDGYALVNAIIKPIAEGFLYDVEPDDSNVTLPAYSTPVKADFVTAFTTAISRITQQLKAITDYFLTIFKFFK